MYNYYPDELIEEIRINNDIVDVISEYVRLEKKGKDYFGICPFHKEKTPSFSVVGAKQIFYCFGCNKGGNVIHFVMNIENLDYIEAIKHLADRARIQLPEGDSDEERERALLKKEILKVNVEAARFFYDQLKNCNEAVQYLRNRKVHEKTVKRFGIGYAPEEWDQLYQLLQEQGFKDEVISKSGLVIPKKTGGYFDRFRKRIMFPIFDIRGNVIAFGGRVMDASEPKYMNSPETLVYNKGRTLYALNFAKNSGQKSIIIVEGYLDAISLHQAGIGNVVASLGTALTESQGRLLKKYVEDVVISYDADTAGQAATMRGLDILNEVGCNVKVLQIPDGKDPDEFIRKNGEAEFKKVLDRTLSLVEYKIKVLKQQYNMGSTEGKIKFLNKTAEILSKIDNRMEREMYLKKISNEYEISVESLYMEINKRINPKNQLKVPNGAITKKTAGLSSNDNKHQLDQQLALYERRLLAILCYDNSVFKAVKESMDEYFFTVEEHRKLAEVVFDRLKSSKGLVPGELLNILEEDIAKDFARIIQKECNFEDNTKAILDIIKKIEIFKLDKRQKEILQLLNKGEELTGGDVDSLKKELNAMIIKRKSL